jgi:hypothetical protein
MPEFDAAYEAWRDEEYSSQFLAELELIEQYERGTR